MRHADAIQLHGEEVLIVREGVGDAGWQALQDYFSPSWTISGNVLRQIGEALGIPVADEVHTPYSLEHDHIALDSTEWAISQNVTVYGRGNQDFKVVDLWASASPHLLEIKMRLQHGKDRKNTSIETVTYCGSYTIWWTAVQEDDTDIER